MSYPAPEPAQHGAVYPGPQDHEAAYPAGDPRIVPPAPSDEIPDFAPERPRPQFKIGGELFSCKVEVPALSMMRYSARAQQQTKGKGEEDFDEADFMLTIDLLRLMLTKESADRLVGRLEDEDNPIGMSAINKLMPWIMEQFGMRPTEPSSDSSDTSPNPDDGQNSTESSPDTESTS